MTTAPPLDLENLADLARQDGPAFSAPWEATAFALRAHLVERGLLQPARFSELYGEELRRGHPAPEDGTADFVAYVRALERAVADIAGDGDLAHEQQRWRDAAEATPHGQPIVLKD